MHASWLQVRCQADGISAREVAKAMLAEHGAGIRLFRQLYSGFAAAAGLSLLVGAVHWFSFCSAKRAALDNLPKLQEAAAEKASTGPAVLSVAAGVVPELEQAVIQYEEVHLHHHSHSQVDGSVTSEGALQPLLTDTSPSIAHGTHDSVHATAHRHVTLTRAHSAHDSAPLEPIPT